MAYQFAEGFDNYGNSYTLTAGYPWDAVSGTWTTSTADFRFAPPSPLPGACGTAAQGAYLRKNLVGTPSTLIVGFGFKVASLPASAVGSLVDFWDSGNYQCALAITQNGALQFYRGNGSPPGGGGNNLSVAIGTATANGTIAANTWYGVAIKIVFGTGTAGSVQLYINGSSTAAINSASLNTIGTANAYATQVSIGNIGSGGVGSIKYDDFYCFDSTGAFLTDLLGGDARVLMKMPSGAGTYTNWTPTGLASNYQNAAVAPPNTSDYNANNVGGTKDSYATQFASLGVAPYFVVVRASLERDDAGTHTPSLFVRSGSTDSAGVATPALSSSYVFYDAVFQNDPATSAPWTALGVDNAQIGIIEG